MQLEACTSSDLKSADAAICAGPCVLVGIVLLTTTAASSVVLYDNASAASGRVVAKIQDEAGTALRSNSQFPMSPVNCLNGIYADVSGTGANYIVYFQRVA